MTVLIPGGRDVRGTLDRPPALTESDPIARLVVACPPHPQMGGDRHDGRLRAVSDALTERGIACVRIDYGPWDDGDGETADVENAIRWAKERAHSVGLFGYSFGGTVALLAAKRTPPDALSVLAPGERVIDGRDPVETVERNTFPGQLLYGERDTVVTSERISEQAKKVGYDVQPLAGDHFFVGQQATIATHVGEFFDEMLPNC